MRLQPHGKTSTIEHTTGIKLLKNKVIVKKLSPIEIFLRYSEKEYAKIRKPLRRTRK